MKVEEPGRSEPIPWAEIGARAGAEYNGDGVSIVPGEDGAVIHSSFQRLRGDATTEGLWLTSTVEGTEADRFRVLATSMGRSEQRSNFGDQRSTFNAAPLTENRARSTKNQEPRTKNHEPRTTNQALPTTGCVHSDGRLVRFVRPGFVEEYSTSLDGVRQDFLVLEGPEGEGELRVELAVDGARAEEADFGARLRLENSGRHVAYSRLHVEDAEGRVLPARIEVAAADRVAILVADADAVYPVRIDPTFSDENWISMGGLPGANRGVLAAVAAEDGTLFVGGRFSVIGDVFANRIARWDGSSWSALGEGMDDTVRALAVVGDHLYAGGGFTMAGGVSANHIARWDGNSWSALGSGMDDWVAALAVSGGDLYAGGSFTTAGGVTANRTARWDGSSWAALDSGMNGGVGALAVSGGDVYAGGFFTTAGGVSANHIARWDGSSWSALGSGMDDTVHALAVFAGDLYAGGRFDTAGETRANHIARWDGDSWSALGEGMNGWVLVLAASGDHLYASGGFDAAGEVSVNGIAGWDGSTWSALGEGIFGRQPQEGFVDSVYALAVSDDNLFAATLGQPTSHIARWDGSSWSLLGSGLDGPVDVLAASGGDLYAGGWFTIAGGATANHIARWDGTSWLPLGSGMNGRVLAIAVSGGDVYAGGEFTTAGGVSANYIARWDGSSWSALGSGMDGADPPRISVRALAVSEGDLFAGGEFTTAGEVNADYIARWDGSSWSALGRGMTDTVDELVVSGGDLYAGGDFTSADRRVWNYIARWDGSSWSGLGGMNERVRSLAVSGGNLYAGGDFTTAGEVSANRIARWDGSSWSALGEGMANTVDALAVSEDSLYAVGRISRADGVALRGISRWDGSSWSVLGSGMNRSVRSLAVSGGDLFVGGDFTIAGGKVSAYFTKTDIAVWLSDGTIAEPSQPGTVVGILSAIEIGEAAPEPTVFTLAGGPGDDDNTFFTIEDDRLKTADALDQEIQDHFTIRVRATYADGTQKEKVFLLRVDRNGFLVWAEDLPPDQRGEADDPGNHGIPNLLRYAFGMDPTAPDLEALPRPVLSEMTVEGESRIHLTLPYTRRTDDPDLIFTPERSEDLNTWTPLVDAEEVSGSDGTTETVIVTDPEPVDAKPKSFLRVRVERSD